MSEKLRTIRLYGVLGAKFGRVHEFVVNSPAEAIKTLCIMVPGFEKFLINSKDRGMAFSVFVGRESLSESQLRNPPGDNDIRIAPVITGSKRAGIGQIIIGVILIVVSFFVPATYPATAAFLAGTGASLAIGGVVAMLSPQAKGLSSQDSTENKPSYAFNGPVNTQAQGNPVPILYGEMIVGSAVISAGIYAEDQQ